MLKDETFCLIIKDCEDFRKDEKMLLLSYFA